MVVFDVIMSVEIVNWEVGKAVLYKWKNECGMLLLSVLICEHLQSTKVGNM